MVAAKLPLVILTDVLLRRGRCKLTIVPSSVGGCHDWRVDIMRIAWKNPRMENREIGRSYLGASIFSVICRRN